MLSPASPKPSRRFVSALGAPTLSFCRSGRRARSIRSRPQGLTATIGGDARRRSDRARGARCRRYRSGRGRHRTCCVPSPRASLRDRLLVDVEGVAAARGLARLPEARRREANRSPAKAARGAQGRDVGVERGARHTGIRGALACGQRRARSEERHQGRAGRLPGRDPGGAGGQADRRFRPVAAGRIPHREARDRGRSDLLGDDISLCSPSSPISCWSQRSRSGRRGRRPDHQNGQRDADGKRRRDRQTRRDGWQRSRSSSLPRPIRRRSPRRSRP